MLALGSNDNNIYNNNYYPSSTQIFWNQNGRLPLLTLGMHVPQGLQ